MSKEDATTQRWTFGGVRIYNDTERRSEWITASGESYWYKHAGDSAYAVGYEYDVLVDEAKTTYGKPTYVGRSEDEELREKLSTLHHGAKIKWDLMRREKNAKADDPLNTKINELAALIKHLPAPQRAGVINYITHKLSRVW